MVEAEPGGLHRSRSEELAWHSCGDSVCSSCFCVGGRTEEPYLPGFKLLTMWSALSAVSSVKEVQVLDSSLEFINEEMEVIARSIGVR